MTEASEGRSLSFDRAADYYDDTRGDTDEVEQSVALLAQQLPVEGRCLEVGVGTGRMAIPLVGRGYDVVGVDISMKMMAKLRAKRESPFPLVQADATRLPFADQSFAAAYSIWVFHLIPGWTEVIDEIARVIRPGASVTVALGGGFGRGPWEDIAARFRSVTGVENVGARNIEEVDAAMVARGFTVLELPTRVTRHEIAPAEILRRLDQGYYSFTWLVEESTRRAAAAATRSWAEQRYGDLDTPLPNEFGATWRRYDRN